MTMTTDSTGEGDLPVCGECGTEVEDDGREFPVSICQGCAETMLREQGLL